MNNVYYRSIFFIFILFYVLQYFGSTRFAGKTIYLNKFFRMLLGKTNRINRIPLAVVVGQILNMITLLIGVFAHRFIDRKIAFEIYKWSIPVFLLVLIIIQELTERDDILK